jgi:hypothetical protein
LVGSLPFETTEEALRECATKLGGLVSSLPDGEVGDRKVWIGYLPEQIYSSHPDLEETRAPDPDAWEAPEHEELDATTWLFRIKPGVKELRLDLGYDRFAIDSYAIFKQLKSDGEIPDDVAFQVCFPATMSAIDTFFEDPEQWPIAHAAYRDAVRREIQTILETVPAEELTIQLDVCQEVIDLATGDAKSESWFPDRTFEEKFTAQTRLVAELAEVVPSEVRLGVHLCYGTWGGWPMIDMKDLRLCVDLANEIATRTQRHIDYFHMPVARTTDPNFFEALRDLNVGDTRVYLGIVHPTDTADDFRDRIDTARQFLDDFGIGAVCGFGREDPAELGDIIGLHETCASVLSAAR